MDGLKSYRKRYAKADRAGRSALLDEFCAQTKYHRKYAIGLLGKPADSCKDKGAPRRRGPTYSEQAVRVLAALWERMDYPWSVRLKAMLPLWLPFAEQHIAGVSEQVKEQLLAMSARQMDRRLAQAKHKRRRRLYGRTKPGTLLKQQIAVRTDFWDVGEPGYCEIDLVSHSGPHAAGEFVYSLNLTDILGAWCESRAIMGKGERAVVDALEEIRQVLPFKLKAIDSDNGSEFINHHLVRYCEKRQITFTRGRPYKKNDNAHIEQKNWTNVRKLFGWDRYDSQEALEAMNALYRGSWRETMNLYQPCVKLVEKKREGSRVTRRYDAPQTPLDRLLAHYAGAKLPKELVSLKRLRAQRDPFELARTTDAQLSALIALNDAGRAPKTITVLGQFTPSPRGGGEQPQQPRANHQTR